MTKKENMEHTIELHKSRIDFFDDLSDELVLTLGLIINRYNKDKCGFSIHSVSLDSFYNERGNHEIHS